MKKNNVYEFADVLGDSDNFVQIESMRMALLMLLDRVHDTMDVQEVEMVLENLWSYSTDDLYGVSVEKIHRNGNYSLDSLGGIFKILGDYRHEWKDEHPRPKTYYMVYAVYFLLTTILWHIGPNRDPGRMLAHFIVDAHSALDDPQSFDWFLDVMVDCYERVNSQLRV